MRGGASQPARLLWLDVGLPRQKKLLAVGMSLRGRGVEP